MGLEEPATPTELDDIYKQFSSTLKPRNAQERKKPILYLFLDNQLLC